MTLYLCLFWKKNIDSRLEECPWRILNIYIFAFRKKNWCTYFLKICSLQSKSLLCTHWNFAQHICPLPTKSYRFMRLYVPFMNIRKKIDIKKKKFACSPRPVPPPPPSSSYSVEKKFSFCWSRIFFVHVELIIWKFFLKILPTFTHIMCQKCISPWIYVLMRKWELITRILLLLY